MIVICEECGCKNYYTKNRPTQCKYCGNVGYVKEIDDWIEE